MEPMSFDYCMGIDYSGAQTPNSRLKGLQVYVSQDGETPVKALTPHTPEGRFLNWSRMDVTELILNTVRTGKRCIIGIDHNFSFPASYFWRYKLKDWDGFLTDFVEHWPTDSPYTYVDDIRERNPKRTGRSDEYRLTEKWTSSAKSVFLFDVQGSVAKSSHAGIPWLYLMRRQVGDLVHFWPFDGFDVPEGKSVIAEAYPALFKRRYPDEGRTPDEQDAYAVARWLSESTRSGIIDRYLHPPLSAEEKRLAMMEGWILGVG